jgi:hypothetical protein
MNSLVLILIILAIVAAITVTIILVLKNKKNGSKSDVNALKKYYTKMADSCVNPSAFADCVIDAMIHKFGYPVTNRMLRTMSLSPVAQKFMNTLMNTCNCAGHGSGNGSGNGSKSDVNALKQYYTKMADSCANPGAYADCVIDAMIHKFGYPVTNRMIRAGTLSPVVQKFMDTLIKTCNCAGK